MGRINKYLFYGLALFPILDFAVLNIVTLLFIVTIPFDFKIFLKTSKKKIIFITVLLALTLLPIFRDDFQCSINYWLGKVLPIYIITFLSLFAAPYITNKDFIKFKNIYIIGSILYIIKFVFIVSVNLYNGELGILFTKKFLFYSDIINLLGTKVDALTTYYHKPYFSLIILLALFFATKNFLEERQKNLNFLLIVFFLICIVYPLSLPNIAITFGYLIYLIYILFKTKKVLLSLVLFSGISCFVLFFIYNSFRLKNLDVTEDIDYVVELIRGEDQNSTQFKSNPRQIIYSSLLKNLTEVPLLGYGYCNGKETVTSVVENKIYNGDSRARLRNNILVNTDLIESHLWIKNGVQVKQLDVFFSIKPIFNDCQSHTLYQILDNLVIDEYYTFSLSVKPGSNNIVIRLGELNNQMVKLNIKNKEFTYIGEDIFNSFIKTEEDGFLRIGITTKIKTPKNLALIGLLSKENQYNHCFEKKDNLIIKQPQLERGNKYTPYSKGLTKNEKNILGSKINAHNIFIQEYYLGGILSLISIVLLYGWFLYLGKATNNLLMFSYVLALIFNSLFENIQYRQMGISILIITSVLLIFKKKHSE